MCTLFVRLTEDDPAYDLVTLLNKTNGVVAKPAAKPKKEKKPVEDGEQEEEEVDEELEAAKASPLGQLVTSGKKQELLDKGFFKSVDKVLGGEHAEVAFNLVFAVLADMGQAGEVNVLKLAGVLSQDTKSKAAALRLRLLVVLYSAYQSSVELSRKLLLALLQYALDTGNSGMLQGQLLPAVVLSWDLKGGDATSMNQLCYEVCSANKETAAAAEFLYQRLATSDKAQAKNSEALIQTAVLGAIAEFNLTRLDQLARLPVVQANKASKSGAVVLELLTVFSTGNHGDFQKFAKANGAFFKANGLDAEKTRQDMQTLTLCALAAEKEVLTYAELCAALQIKSDDDLEQLLIETVASGRLDAAIDQEKSEVFIRRTIERSFDDTKWASLSDKIDAWRGAVVNTLNTLQPPTQQAQTQQDRQ